MATVIDQLMITLGIDANGAKKGMQDVTSTVKSSMQNITSTLQGGFASVSKIFTGFGAALMGAFSVGSAFSTWKEQAAELGSVSKRLRMSIEDVQGWTGAIGKFGGSAQDFEGTLRGLNGQLARMATIGKSRAGTLLQSLGIDAGEVGRQRNALAVLEDLAGVMEQMTPDEARGIGAALGLDPSTIMLLQQGRDGMKDLIRQKKEDAVYTQEDADAVKAYSVEMGKLKKGFMGIMGVLFRSVMPAFTLVTKYVGQFVNFLRKHQTAVKVFFTMISALVLGMLLPAFVTFTRALMANPITWVILALAALALVIEDLIVWMDGGESALDDFWEALFGDRENAKKTFKDIKESLLKLWNVCKFVFGHIAGGKAWQDMKDHANTALQLIKDRWQILMRNLKQGWENFKRIAMAPFQAIARGVGNLRLGWSRFTAGLKTRWTDATNAIAEAVRTAIGGATDWVAAKWQAFMRSLKQGWDDFKRNAMTPFRAIARGIEDVRLGWSRFTAGLKRGWDDFVKSVQTTWSNFTMVLTNGWVTATGTILDTWQWVKDTMAEGWQWLSDTIIEILDWIQAKAAEAWQWIKDKCQEALDRVIQKWNEFKAVALDALNSLFAPIDAIAGAIRDTIGDAIDWVVTKWQNLKAMVGAGEVFSQSSTSYLGWPSGGNTTNNSSASYSIGTVNVQADNPYDFTANVWGAAGYQQSNGGGI